MADPVTAAVIGKVIVKAAASEFGKSIGKAIAANLFAKDDSAIRESLARIEGKLGEILDVARSTHAMVTALPAYIDAAVLRGRLDGRYAELAGVAASFRSARRWSPEIAAPSILAFNTAWLDIVAHEFRIDSLARLPMLAELGIAISDGRQRAMILDGIDRTIARIDRQVTGLQEDAIAPAAAAIEASLATKYVERGSLLAAPPWAQWSMHGKRTVTWSEWISVGFDPVTGERTIQVTRTEEDAVWSAGLESTRAALSQSRGALERAMQGLHACVFLGELLKAYRKAMASRKGAPRRPARSR